MTDNTGGTDSTSNTGNGTDIYKPGSIIHLTADEIEVLKSKQERIWQLSFAYEQAGKELHDAHKDLFLQVRAFYPNTGKYHLHIDWKTGRIIVQRKWDNDLGERYVPNR